MKQKVSDTKEQVGTFLMIMSIDESTNPSLVKKQCSTLFSFMNKPAKQKENSLKSEVLVVIKEISNYLEEDTLTEECNPLDFWKDHGCIYLQSSLDCLD